MAINRKKATVIYSKIEKAQVLQSDKQLVDHVPVTHSFTRGRLLSMLKQHGMVYVKPDVGSAGVGVMRVDRTLNGYCYQSGIHVCAFHTFQGMFESIRNRIDGQPYLIQKGIHVLRYKNRPFDFRVMVQKNRSNEWEYTGTAGRVAHPKKIVSNGSQGGTIMSAQALLCPIAGGATTKRLEARMKRLALLTARQFSRVYPAINELGLDIAIDRCLKPWILEVNTRPDPCPFTKLNDRAIIRKIVRYGAGYGRSYCLTCSKAKSPPTK